MDWKAVDERLIGVRTNNLWRNAENWKARRDDASLNWYTLELSIELPVIF
jgi:hypothetical protein